MSRGIRVRRRRVQTAVRRFRRGDGRQVTLVATVHYAPADYFIGLREVICRLEDNGARVFCEGLDRFDGPAEPDPSADEADVIDLWLRVEKMNSSNFAENSGYATQRDVLVRDTWRNIDLPRLGMLRLVGVEGMRQLVNTWLDKAATDDPHAELARRAADITQTRVLSSRIPLVVRRVAAAEHPLLVVRRRQIILERLRAAAVEDDVVAVYGSAHHRAMCDDLRAHGFRQAGVSWHTAHPFPSFREQGRILGELQEARQAPTPPVDAGMAAAAGPDSEQVAQG